MWHFHLFPPFKLKKMPRVKNLSNVIFAMLINCKYFDIFIKNNIDSKEPEKTYNFDVTFVIIIRVLFKYIHAYIKAVGYIYDLTFCSTITRINYSIKFSFSKKS